MQASSRPSRLPALRQAAVERFFDLLFPRLDCPFCGGLAGAARDAGICPQCLASLTLHARLSVAQRVPGSAHGIACGLHDDVLASAVRRFKYGPDESLGEPLGRLLAARVAMAAADGIPVDAVIPVPLHRARLLKRGFNQAEVLASYVAQRLSVPLRPGWLHRTRQTKTQASLGRVARMRNMREAFSADRRVSPRRVLLVDDVITTGATLQACVEALGAVDSVSFAVIAAAPD